MKTARQLELESELLRTEKQTHDLSVSIEANDGARADNFLHKMDERKALLEKKGAIQDQLIAELEAQYGKAKPAGDRSQSAEMRQLIDSADAREVLAAVVDHRAPSGATAELQREMKVGVDVIPWSLFEKSAEAGHRAAATFTADTGEASIPQFVGRAFYDSLAEFLGIPVQQVPVGESDWPVLSTGATVGHQTDSTTIAETTGAFTVAKLSPRNRYGASFSIRNQDLIAYGEGASAALEMDLRAAVRDDLDDALLTKDREGLLTAAVAANPSTPGSASTYAQYIAALYGGVDGLHASDVSQVRMLVDSTTYAHMGATLPTNGNDSAAEKAGRLAMIRVRKTASGANFRDALVAGVGNTPNAVMALFGGGVRILVDPYTRATEGETRINAQLYGDVAVLRAAAYTRHRFRVA